MGDYFFGEEVMGAFSLGSRLFDGCVPALRGVSLTEDVVLVWRDGSALRAGVLSFASPKESSGGLNSEVQHSLITESAEQ